MLDYLPRNSRVTLFLEPYSSVLACILTFYGVLYMQAIGLDARQIGLIATVAAVTGLITQLAAAPVTNRLGRRRTLLWFSIICWSIPLLLWALADSFVVFLLAAVIFSSSRITSVAWYCVTTEDVDDDKKVSVFGLLFIIGSMGGLVTAFTGPVMERFGLVSSMRFLYGFASVSMTIMFIVRHRLLTETHAGAEVNNLHAGMTMGGSLRRHVETVRANLGDREFLHLVTVFVLFNFVMGMSFVQVLFVNNVLRLTMSELSLIPPVAAIVAMTLFRVVVPRLRDADERKVMMSSLAAFAVGVLLVLLIPPGNLGLVLLASGVASGGSYLFLVSINAVMNNRMGLLHKADVYSAVQLLAALVMVPAGYIAGGTFAVSPPMSIVLIGVMIVAAEVVLLHSREIKPVLLKQVS